MGNVSIRQLLLVSSREPGLAGHLVLGEEAAALYSCAGCGSQSGC